MADLPRLGDLDRRILGALMEKQVTVPGSYPMTLNALRTACNQSSSREPVTDHDETAISEGAKALKERGLLRIVWADRGPRTLKYHQLLTEEIDVDVAEAAVLTVMLLRGPQAPGELKTRTERLHAFADRAEVEALLERMAERGLVRPLPHRPGQRDQRWADLLSEDAPEAAPPRATTTADPLREGPDARDDRVRATYGAVAESYAETHEDPFGDLPIDRMLLERAVAEAGARPIADVGCGTGAASAFLHARGGRVRGFDLTPEMVEQARSRVPGVEFAVGDLRRLLKPADADGWGAITSWYSLIHLDASELPDAVASLARTLAPGGLLALALQAGPPGGTAQTLTEWFDHGGLDLDFVRHDPVDVVRAVEAAGLVEVELVTRTARAWAGERTDRMYVVGRRPT